MLSRGRILELFAELDEELAGTGIRGDVFMVGRAAMAVAYDAGPATRDVDAIWHPSTEVRHAAERVAARHPALDPGWLNDGVKALLPGDDRGDQRVVYEGCSLAVSAASPEYLLATKLLASRVSRDEDDILLLFHECGYATVEDGLDVLDRYYPGRPIEAKVRSFLEELLASWPSREARPSDEPRVQPEDRGAAARSILEAVPMLVSDVAELRAELDEARSGGT